VEPGRIFLDVYPNGYEFLIDEGCELRVSVRFGFQPSACPSRGCGAEIHQHRFVLCLGLAECSVYVFVPRNRHFCSPENRITAIDALDAPQLLQDAILLFSASF
jgi:hypothetical protein